MIPAPPLQMHAPYYNSLSNSSTSLLSLLQLSHHTKLQGPSRGDHNPQRL